MAIMVFSQKKNEKGQIRQKVYSKLVIHRENIEDLANLACSFRHSQKGQNMLDPPTLLVRKNLK